MLYLLPLAYIVVESRCLMCVLTVLCFIYLSFSEWPVFLRLSGHEYFGHATNFILELLDNSVLQCPECNPFENYWTDCSNIFGCVWLNVEFLCCFLCISLCSV